MKRRENAGRDAVFPPARLAAALERRRAHRLAEAARLAPRLVDEGYIHVAVRDPDACARACGERCCTFLCPAAVFQWLAPDRLVVRYELCVECGACRLFCPLDNVELDTPRGGYGIFHRFG